MQVFHIKMPGGAIYWFVAEKVGLDGNGNTVLVGACDIDTSFSPYSGQCCVVLRRSDNTMLALHRGPDSNEAAQHAIQSKRKGYGHHPDKHRAFLTYDGNGQEVEGYEAD